jgi:ubiquinone/menaquinone biosynthesis C-methylase UbiE
MCERPAACFDQSNDDARWEMGIGGKIQALTYDRMSRKTERMGLRELRHKVVGTAGGRVLEIGAGTGANLPHYRPDVESLTVTEPEPAMLKRLGRRMRDTAVQATVLRAPAEDLPFEDATFDTVVSTLVLCGVHDQPRALREVRRVLKPGGRLVFIEHVRSDDAGLAKLQDRMNGFNRVVVRCECNRPTLDTIRAAGFEVTELDRDTLRGAPRFVQPLIVGTAVSP